MRGQDYEVFIGDVRLWIPKVKCFTYPDVMVIAGQPEYYNNQKDTITNAQVIIEVLSKSTKNYDRGEKFRFYQTIPSFQEYILIEQNLMFIEQYSKQKNKRWSYSLPVGYADVEIYLGKVAIAKSLQSTTIENTGKFSRFLPKIGVCNCGCTK